MTQSHFSALRLAAVIAAALIGCTLPSSAAQVSAVNWKQQEAEILRHYRALVQIDTSSPPGNETAAVDYLKRTLEAEGIPAQDLRARTSARQSRRAPRGQRHEAAACC